MSASSPPRQRPILPSLEPYEDRNTKDRNLAREFATALSCEMYSGSLRSCLEWAAYFVRHGGSPDMRWRENNTRVDVPLGRSPIVDKVLVVRLQLGANRADYAIESYTLERQGR